MYHYSDVENALAIVFWVRPEGMGALRGRIKHFQRIGLTIRRVQAKGS